MHSDWIWIDDTNPEQPRMVFFRKLVTISALTSDCVLHINADSRYVLLVNGHRVAVGPCRAPRGVWYYDTVDIGPYLQVGENELFVKVIQYTDHKLKNIHFKTGPASVQTEGIGGLWIEELDTNYGFATTSEYSCIEVTGYTFPEAQVFGYVSFTEHYDSRPVHENTVAACWKPAVALFRAPEQGIGALRDTWYGEPRTIPQPYEKIGLFQHTVRNTFHYTGDGKLTVTQGESAYIELDAGCVINAYPQLCFCCGEGSCVRIIYAEGYGTMDASGTFRKGLRDNPEDQCIHGQYDVYIAHGGSQKYIPFLYRNFRVIRIEVTAEGNQPFIMDAPWYIQTGYPLEISGSFHGENPVFNRIWDISKRTLLCCMYETYMDCPYYEQMQYTMDTFLQVQYTLSISADARLARKAICDFAQSQMPDGLMPCNTPAKFRQIIPGFPFYWILMLHSYMMYVGEPAFIRSHLGTLDKLLQFYVCFINEDGLLGDTGYWQFFDWVKEWKDGSPVKEGEINILYNMLYVYGLRKAGELNRYCGRFSTAEEYESIAESVAYAVRRLAYHTESGLFADVPGGEPISQHAQIFAVLSSVAPAQDKRAIMERMLARKNSLAVPSYCFRYFLCRALEETGLYKEVNNSLRMWDAYEDLMRLGLTTWPEDFVTMRSDCHGWSAVPLYEFAACFLGVQPIAPGYAKVRIRPLPCPLKEYGGTVPVGDKGVVQVAICNKDGKYQVDVTLPEGLECEQDYSFLEWKEERSAV